MRADLTARRQNYQGRTYWVVKEPIGLKYFRFQEEEFAVLNMLRRDCTLEEIKESFEDEFAPHKITYQDLQQFIGTLHRSGLIISDAPDQGKQLKKRRDERAHKELMGKLSNVLSIRFKGIDPERLLRILHPLTRWMFTRAAVLCFLVLGLSALTLLGVNFDIFRSRLPAFDQFFGPKNWLYLGIVLCVTKIIHEFGHGLLCHHFGGECHEMGVMFLVLTPCLYCNVSDSWMLPNKWHRAAIGAGGIYFELIMASIATFVWWFSDPGMLNHLALRVMFICSVSTVLFNGNPLLRFDGYYILADIMEIPNMRQKASKIVQNAAAKHCLGIEMPEDPFLPQSNRAMFGLYTVAAVAYRWFIFFSILFFLNQVFEPYGLKPVGQLIAIMGLYGLIIQPIWQGAKFLHIPGRMDQLKWPNLLISLGILATLILAVLFIPVPHNVKCTFQLQPRDSDLVFVTVPGAIREVRVQPGHAVEEGQVIAVLENSDLNGQLLVHENEKKLMESQLAFLEKHRWQKAQADALIPQLKTQIQAKELELAERRKELSKLTIKATRSGTVLSPPFRPEEPVTDKELPRWSGSPLDARNLGVMMQPGDLLCHIGTPGEFEAVLAVDQSDVNLLKIDQKVKMVLDAITYQAVFGTVEEIAPQEMQSAPQVLANQTGGSLATRTDADGVVRPLSTTYEVVVKIPPDPMGLYRTGFRGQAHIRSGRQTLGAQLWEYLTRTFHFYM